MRATGLFAVLALTAACGAEGESSRPEADQCRDMLDTYCAKDAACAAPSERTNRGQDCGFALKLQTPCDDLDVLGDMAWCLNAINAVDCLSFDATQEHVPWPDACKGILGTP